jgi:solute carrier family 26 (sodium-independent sulfate anion transporter), member 11
MAANPPTAKQRLDKVFGVKEIAPEYNEASYAASVPSLANADIYIETEPTVKEYFQEIIPTWRDVGSYIYRLFPFLSWIGKYNLTWALGDVIAGKFVASGRSVTQSRSCPLTI